MLTSGNRDHTPRHHRGCFALLSWGGPDFVGVLAFVYIKYIGTGIHIYKIRGYLYSNIYTIQGTGGIRAVVLYSRSGD